MSAFCTPPHSSPIRARRAALQSPRERRRCCPAPRARAASDVVVVGAGMAGLSTAFELAQRGVAVRVVAAPDRRPAALAAAGMLAPSAEKLSSPLLQLAEQSLRIYPAFVNNVQAVSGMRVHYVARSDFLVPFFDNAPGDGLIRGDAVRVIEPALSDRVVAVQRHPRDASVDSRRLTHALRVACEKLGVTFDHEPIGRIVTTPDATHVAALEKHNGEHIHASHFVVAAGAWAQRLLPMMPIRPVKGQMISLVPPPRSHPLLNHVIYSNVYIVPKNDFTEFYVGATVEDIGFDSRNTPAGIKHLIDSAIELIPAMADYEIREMWTGFRPATPDENPIFGHCSYDNLSVVNGFYRNGVLFAPIGAKIAAAYAMGETAQLSPELRHLLGRFTIDRFYQNNDNKPPLDSSTKHQTLEAGTVQSTSENSASKSPMTTGGPVEREVKLWKVLSNGTSEPVYPPGWKGPRNVSPAAPSLADSDKQHMSPTFTQQATTPTQTSETNVSPEATDPRNPENISAVNDAYDDILHKRGPNMHKSMSNALAKNRAFGREPSSLQREDGPVLSLSEEEVQRYNAAAEMGYRDMQDLEQCFDPDHESVTTTKIEGEASDGMKPDPKIFVSGIEFTTPSHRK